MKKIIVMVTLMFIFIGCTAEDRMLWEEVQRENMERGRKCFYTHKGERLGCRYADE